MYQCINFSFFIFHSFIFLHSPRHLPIFPFPLQRDVYPVAVAAVFTQELAEVEVVHDPLCPLAHLLPRLGTMGVGHKPPRPVRSIYSPLHYGGGAGGEAKGTYIRRLAADMLAVRHSAHSPIQFLAAVAAADVDGFVEVLAQRFQHLFAQVPDVRHQCRRHSVVDVEPGGRPRPLELF